METYHFKDLSYRYPGAGEEALTGVSFSLEPGDFLVVCGPSGSGKSTLLRLLKEQNPSFGYVMQNPSTQIVTDKVYHELAFGMENRGVPVEEMKRRIAETATYFGMEDWMERDTWKLSGGEKQILNLASVLVTAPEVVLFDEPTSQLDPMAALSFLDIVKRLNEQTGLTVVLVEQRLEEVLSVCDKMLLLQEGGGAVCGPVGELFTGICRGELGREILDYLPSYVRLYDRISETKDHCPGSVKEARKWLAGQQSIELAGQQGIGWEKKGEARAGCESACGRTGASGVPSVLCRDVFVRYERKEQDVLERVSCELTPGHVYGIVGGNGSGKSTFVKVLAGVQKAYHGKITVPAPERVAYFPQEPKYMFLGDRLCDIIKDKDVIRRFGLEEIMERHPYDVSGGQMQRAAMALLAQKDADLYLFDEPTKGLDPSWKKRFGQWLSELSNAGKTVLVVSHDVEFTANTCEYVSMCFHREITEPVPVRQFFRSNEFYTTAIHRIARDCCPELVLERDFYGT